MLSSKYYRCAVNNVSVNPDGSHRWLHNPWVHTHAPWRYLSNELCSMVFDPVKASEFINVFLRATYICHLWNIDTHYVLHVHFRRFGTYLRIITIVLYANFRFWKLELMRKSRHMTSSVMASMIYSNWQIRQILCNAMPCSILLHIHAVMTLSVMILHLYIFRCITWKLYLLIEA